MRTFIVTDDVRTRDWLRGLGLVECSDSNGTAYRFLNSPILFQMEKEEKSGYKFWFTNHIVI